MVPQSAPVLIPGGAVTPLEGNRALKDLPGATANRQPRTAPAGEPPASASGPVVVRARGLTKRFGGAAVVDGVDLEVSAGECFGLLGPNGAGKSTTIRMILGLSPITAGELTVLGWPIPGREPEVRARCGVVPQEDNLDIDLTVEANLQVYARYFGLRGRTVEERITRLLDFFQLAARRADPIDALSGGMRRRLTLARALVNDPSLVVLDEPTTGLDPQARRLVWQQLRRLKDEGRTLLLTTHYMEEATQLCDRVVIMDGGRILTEGAPRDLIARYVEPQVVEVPVLRQAAPKAGDLPGCRLVWSGDTVYCYADDEGPVLDWLRANGVRTYFHRPANLEDVYMRLTGHELVLSADAADARG